MVIHRPTPPSYARSAVREAARSYAALMLPADRSFPIFVKEQVEGGHSLAAVLSQPWQNHFLVLGVPPYQGILDGATDRIRKHVFKVIDLSRTLLEGRASVFREVPFKNPEDENRFQGDFQELLQAHLGLITEGRTVDFALGAILHDVGKIIEPSHFHDEASAVLAENILEAWGLPPERRDYILKIVAGHLLFGELISRETTPSYVLKRLQTETTDRVPYGALFSSLLLFNLIDMAGYWSNIPLHMIPRYLRIGEPEKIRELGRSYFEERLGVVCRSYEEGLIQGLPRTRNMDHLLREIDRQVGADEQGNFHRLVSDEALFYGVSRSLRLLPPELQIRFLHFALMGAHIHSRLFPGGDENLRVILTDPMTDPNSVESYGPYQAKLVTQVRSLPEAFDRPGMAGEVEAIGERGQGMIFGFHIDAEPGVWHLDLRI